MQVLLALCNFYYKHSSYKHRELPQAPAERAPKAEQEALKVFSLAYFYPQKLGYEAVATPYYCLTSPPAVEPPFIPLLPIDKLDFAPRRCRKFDFLVSFGLLLFARYAFFKFFLSSLNKTKCILGNRKMEQIKFQRTKSHAFCFY